MVRADAEVLPSVFLSSQLIQIAQRFPSDVEDLQVLLQEEGLPVRSPECLQQLFARLSSDPRFRRDISFLVQSMLYREPDEPGTLDVLGILVVATAGTRQQLDTPPQQQLLRDLLRFVMQQRRASTSAAASAVIPAPRVEASGPIDATPPPVSSGLVIRPERPSPAVAPPAAQMAPPDYVPLPDAMPSLAHTDPEPVWRRLPSLALLLIVIGLVAGLAFRHGFFKARTPATPPVASTQTAALPASPLFAQQPEQPRGLAPTPALRHAARRHSPLAWRPGFRRAEPPQSPAPMTLAANVPPEPLETPRSAQPTPQPPLTNPQPVPTTPQSAQVNPARAQSNPQPAQPSPKPASPAPQRPNAAAATLPPPAVRPSAPAPAAVSSVFAHPEVAAAATSGPAPSFDHPKDPVLIARNNAPTLAPANLEPQATVHTGATGTMASNLMYSPEPEYPANAIAAGVQGEVTVRAVVGPRGNVINARVVSGPPLLRDAALAAVGRWRYRPYEQDGQPVAIATIAILDFQIPPGK